MKTAITKKKLVRTSKLVCYKCKTDYGDTDNICPNCGSKVVKVVPLDSREHFVEDNRKARPL